VVSKEQKKIERVINFMKKGLTSLADELGETVKGINDFIKSLAKAQKDLKEITVGGDVQTVSTSSTKIVASAPGSAKTAAASTLFSLLSGGGEAQAAPTPTVAPLPAAPTLPTSAPPSGPPKKGAPPSAPPQKGGLPPAPKLPPSGPPKAPTSPAGPPKAPSTPTQTPAFAKRPTGPPAASPTGPPRPPAATPPAAAAAAAPQAGGGLSSLRDEMLDELNRLKKIMRGE
jgi:hypothetical protein